MTIRSTLILILLGLGILLVGLMTAFGAEAALPLDRVYDSSPPLRLDSLEFQAQEAAQQLIRKGCLEAIVVTLPDREGELQVYATCVEGAEHRPGSH